MTAPLPIRKEEYNETAYSLEDFIELLSITIQD